MPNKQSATKVLKSMGNARRRNSIKKQDQTRSNNTKSHGNPSGNGNKKIGDQTNTNNAATGFTGSVNHSCHELGPFKKKLVLS